MLNDEEGFYLAQELEDAYGVKFIKTEAAIGLRGTNEFLKKIGTEFGKDSEVEKLIEDNDKEIQKSISQKILSGKKIVLDGHLADLLRLIDVIELFNGEIAGLFFTTIDTNDRKLLQRFHEVSPITPIIIGEGQYFEKANLLSKVIPDFYISQKDNVSFAAEVNSSIVPVSLAEIPTFGYEGLSAITDAINQASVFRWTDNTVYKDSWLKKSGNWYVKQETK